MKFEEFYKKYFGTSHDDFYVFAKEGLAKMRQSLDSIHAESHVENLLGYLNEFLIRHKKLKKRLNMESLFLAICWHDVWKSERDPKNLLQIFWGQIAEGFLASRIFNKEAKKYSVDKKIVAEASYTIRKHNPFQVLRRKSPESKLFNDIDRLDTVNAERFTHSRNKKLIRFYISKISKDHFYYSWAREVFREKRGDFLKKFTNFDS